MDLQEIDFDDFNMGFNSPLDYVLTDRKISPDITNDINSGFDELGISSANCLIIIVDDQARIYYSRPLSNVDIYSDILTSPGNYMFENPVDKFISDLAGIKAEIEFQSEAFALHYNTSFSDPRAILHVNQEKYFGVLASYLGYIPRKFSRELF